MDVTFLRGRFQTLKYAQGYQKSRQTSVYYQEVSQCNAYVLGIQYINVLESLWIAFPYEEGFRLYRMPTAIKKSQQTSVYYQEVSQCNAYVLGIQYINVLESLWISFPYEEGFRL